MSGIKELCAQFWEWRMREFPEFASFCGLSLHDDKLSDLSVSAHERRGNECEKMLHDLNKIEVSELKEDDQLNLVLLKAHLTIYVKGIQYKGYLNQVHTNEGVQIEFGDIISWTNFNTKEDYKKYVKRLEALSQRVKQTEESLKTAVELNKTNSQYSMAKVVDTIDSLCKKTETSIFYQPFVEATNLKSDEMEDLRREVDQVLVQKVFPAFSSLKAYIENVYMENLRPSIGVSSWPDGQNFYKEVLQWHLTLDMTPEQVHQQGLDQVARIKTQMNEVIKKVNFQGDFKAFVNFLRTDPRFYYNSKEELLDGFRDLCDNHIRPKLPQLFHEIPKSNLIIEESPPSKPNAPAGYYIAGTLDGSRPGKYFVNCCNLKMVPKYEMMTLSLHEGEPGHHFQGMYAIEMKGVPEFRKHFEDMNYYSPPSRFPMYTAYIEGWGLYCEYLGNEMGLYEDPYSLFGHLSFEMHRACRLVADTGIHAFGWNRESAIALFLENTALAEDFVIHEVDRYITWPGQACGYMIGQLKLKELRQKASRSLGDLFDVRDFHEVVLKCGMVPMDVLENIINKYITNTKTRNQ